MRWPRISRIVTTYGQANDLSGLMKFILSAAAMVGNKHSLNQISSRSPFIGSPSRIP